METDILDLVHYPPCLSIPKISPSTDKIGELLSNTFDPLCSTHSDKISPVVVDIIEVFCSLYNRLYSGAKYRRQTIKELSKSSMTTVRRKNLSWKNRSVNSVLLLPLKLNPLTSSSLASFLMLWWPCLRISGTNHSFSPVTWLSSLCHHQSLWVWGIYLRQDRQSSDDWPD